MLKSSIKAKLSALVLAAVMSAVILTALTSAFRETDRRFQSKRAEVEGIAAALSAAVAFPLAQRNAADVGRALSAMRNIPEIAFVQVLDANGMSVVQFGNSIVLERPDQRVTPNTDLSLFSTLFLRNYVLERPIVSSGNPIGTLRIIANVSSLQTALRESMISALLAGAIAAALGLLLAHHLQRSITAPIASLTTAIQDIRVSQDFSRSVDRTSQDETGVMVDAFNDMMGQVRFRDKKLAEHRDRLEVEVEERTAELKDATVAAQTANAAKSEFLATMSHEIRTPLNGMLVMAELLSTGDLPDRLQRHADVIVSSGQSLLAIINDILDLSKIEAGRMELEKIPVEPATISDQVMSLFAARAAGKGIDLACYVSPDVPSRILADPVRLNQVLSNLVNNALKFTEKGSVVLRVEAVERSIAPGDACRVRFSVTDTGIGIPEDKLQAIFDPFSQADQSTTRKFGGTGIGLSISKKLVSAMGGAIEVNSLIGQGSTFHFSIETEAIDPAPRRFLLPANPSAILALPPSASRDVLAHLVRDCGFNEAGSLSTEVSGKEQIIFCTSAALQKLPARAPGVLVPRIAVIADVGDVNAATLVDEGLADDLIHRPLSGRDVRAALECAVNPEAAARRIHEKPKAQPVQFTGANILAADDSAVNREVLAEALGRLGVKLTLVENGLAAVEAAAAGAYDLIFMDCSMPVMDGYAATRKIRADENETGAAAVPIIALTAHVAGSHANSWRDAGMNETLSKPFTLKGLTACLTRWLSATKEAAPDAAATGPQDFGGPRGPAPVLNREVLDDIRQMQGPGGDLVSRIIGLFNLHAPDALERLATAMDSGSTDAIAEYAHALKSLCRNIGAQRLGDMLHKIEYDARGGKAPPSAILTQLSRELDYALAELSEVEDASAAATKTKPPEKKRKRAKTA